MNKYNSQAEKAYLILKEKILNQEIKQGSPVIERDLAADLDISRTPIREAIRQLSSDGLIEIIPRKGAYIRTFTINDLIQLYEIAEGLEGMVAFLVAEKQSKGELKSDDINDLEDSVAKMRKYQNENNLKSWVKADEMFHRKLYFLCGNEYIKESIMRIRTQLNVTLLNMIPAFMDIEQSDEEHIQILNALKSGLPEKARRIMQTQHERVRIHLKNNSLI